VSNVKALRPFSQASVADRRLVDVSREERSRHQQSATQFRSAGHQRANAEREVIGKRETPKANSAPRHVAIDLPHAHSGPRQHTETFRPAEKTFTPHVDSPRSIDRHPREYHFDTQRPKTDLPRNLVETPRHIQPAPRHIDLPKVTQPNVIHPPKPVHHEAKHQSAPHVYSQPKVTLPPAVHHAPVQHAPKIHSAPVQHAPKIHAPPVQHAPKVHSPPKQAHSNKPHG